MISLPFSFIYPIYVLGSGKFLTRYNGKVDADESKLHGERVWKYPPCTKLSTAGLDNLIARPERTIMQLGANFGDYRISRHRFPEGVSVNGFPVTPFPVLILEDVNHGVWLSKLEKEVEAKLNKYSRLREKIRRGKASEKEIAQFTKIENDPHDLFSEMLKEVPEAPF